MITIRINQKCFFSLSKLRRRMNNRSVNLMNIGEAKAMIRIPASHKRQSSEENWIVVIALLISALTPGIVYGQVLKENIYLNDKVIAVERSSTSLTVDTTAPAVTITSPTSNTTYSTSSNPIGLGGSTSDNIGVTQVTWSSNRGGSGTCSGTTSWTCSGITLSGGENVLTVTGRDAANNYASDSLTVTLSCSYSIDPWYSNIGPDGGYGGVDITTGSGCTWVVDYNGNSWISGDSSGNGSATINYSVEPYYGSNRQGYIYIANIYFYIGQTSQCDYDSYLMCLSFTGGNTGFCGAMNGCQ
jgi:hypothetical protein